MFILFLMVMTVRLANIIKVVINDVACNPLELRTLVSPEAMYRFHNTRVAWGSKL